MTNNFKNDNRSDKKNRNSLRLEMDEIKDMTRKALKNLK